MDSSDMNYNVLDLNFLRAYKNIRLENIVEKCECLGLVRWKSKETLDDVCV